MERLKEKCHEIITDKNLYIFSVITIIFFGAFCMLQYALDTYSVFTDTIRKTALHFFSCGRYITGLATIFAMKILKLDNTGTYYLSYIFAMVCTIISLYRLNNIIKKYTNNNALSIISTSLIIINPFSIELYIYIEKGIMMLSVLLCVLAVEQICKFFEGNKKSIIWAMILMFMANCAYQGTVGIFVAVSMIFILKYSDNIKKFIINNIVVALTYGIPALLNFLSVRFLFSNDRVSGNMVLTETMSKVIAGSKNMMINTYNILPKNLFIVFILLSLGAIIYKAIKDNTTIKCKTIKILGALYIILGTFFATVAPQLLQDTASIWFVARSSYPMAAVIGLLLLYLCLEFELKPLEKNIIIVFAIIFAIIQFVSFMQITIDNYVGNYMDKQISLKIKNKVEEYEEETGNIIDTIAIYHDKETRYTYDEIKASGDMNVRAYSSDWCTTAILKLYLNREFKNAEKDYELEKEFMENNWNEFDEKQIVFEKNIMHLCIY